MCCLDTVTGISCFWHFFFMVHSEANVWKTCSILPTSRTLSTYAHTCSLNICRCINNSLLTLSSWAPAFSPIKNASISQSLFSVPYQFGAALTAPYLGGLHSLKTNVSKPFLNGILAFLLEKFSLHFCFRVYWPRSTSLSSPSSLTLLCPQPGTSF